MAGGTTSYPKLYSIGVPFRVNCTANDSTPCRKGQHEDCGIVRGNGSQRGEHGTSGTTWTWIATIKKNVHEGKQSKVEKRI